MKLIYILFGLVFFHQLQAQQQSEFKVEISNDTVLLGNYFEVKFSLNNVTGKFTPPSFVGLNIIAGPNKSSSYSMINGEVNQSSSYTYYLEAELEGNYIIGPANLQTTNELLSTPQLHVVVLPNPEGIKQRPKSNFGEEYFQKETPVKATKRKTIKI